MTAGRNIPSLRRVCVSKPFSGRDGEVNFGVMFFFHLYVNEVHGGVQIW
jgi:hypothetical protein